jgi:hypothetical protein
VKGVFHVRFRDPDFNPHKAKAQLQKLGVQWDMKVSNKIPNKPPLRIYAIKLPNRLLYKDVMEVFQDYIP